MEIRRVQLTGGSSFVITLPKEWAEKHKVKKNDPLGIVTQPDGTLLITKEISETQVQRIKEIDIGTITEPDYLFRLLIGSYIAGFTLIRIRSKQRFPPFVPGVVRNFIHMTIGQQVVEETETLIVLKDLLNPSEMPFENTLKRMYVIVKNMHQDAIHALVSGDGKLADDIIARDNDVDRLNWLVARQMHMMLRDVSLGRKMGVSGNEAMNYLLISRITERIGDHACRIAENIRFVIGQDIDPDILKKIQEASKLSVGILDRAVVSFIKGDIAGSHRNIEAVPALETLCDSISGLIFTEETKLALAVSYIAESIRRSGEYASDISENVINYLVSKEEN